MVGVDLYFPLVGHSKCSTKLSFDQYSILGVHDESKNNFQKQLWNSMFFVVIGLIWFKRTQVKFQGHVFDLSVLQEQVKLRIGM